MRANSMCGNTIVLFVVPSLRVGGGTMEIVRLASELRGRGVDARMLSLWRHPNSTRERDIPDIVDVPIVSLSELRPRLWRAPFDLALLMCKFHFFFEALRRETRENKINVVLTHYSTLVLLWFVPTRGRYCFVQGEEWNVLPPGLGRKLLRVFIIGCCRRCRVVTANPYLTASMYNANVVPIAETRMWATPDFQTRTAGEYRRFDFAVVLRRGYAKRLDLYMQLFEKARRIGLKSVAIACDDDVASRAASLVDLCLLRPSKNEMRSVYRQTKIFILLSETEGFGLPPLEAMGAGCVPICRDSGGVRCYMTGSLVQNLIPLEDALDQMIQRLCTLLADRKLLNKLSLEATQIFVAGANETSQERNKALACLASM